MIKYFHELTKDEFQKLPDMAWAECAKEFPQPEWCGYPDALSGMMGCWSLMDYGVVNRNYCKNCDCYIKKVVVKRKACPRCIKGQMSFDVYTKEDFCIQCGYRVERK